MKRVNEKQHGKNKKADDKHSASLSTKGHELERNASKLKNYVSRETTNVSTKDTSTTKVKKEDRHEEIKLQTFPKTKLWWVTFSLLLILAAVTRLHKVQEPDHVCWDETHFGKMGSFYINRTFFFDVHPPLGKMLIGAAGLATGYNGSFAFNKPGDKYEDTPYEGMRICCAFLGIGLVPLAFLIVWEMNHSLLSAVCASSLVLLDTGTLVITRYILLDPFLLFFIMASTYCVVKFNSYQKQPFTFYWWFWMILTGVFLACAISVKFVGLFIVLLAGYNTIMELWEILGDLSNTLFVFIKHFIARAICLIVLPALLYVFFFWIHFKVLSKSGSGDGFFSSAFQSQLEGNALHNAMMPDNIAYGSVVTIKNYRTGGAYLHSHWHLYPEGVGARQQQVTTYSHKDENNKWLVKNFDVNPGKNDTVELVKNGDFIRLEHLVTQRNLHSHKEPAPLTARHFQTTCYGMNGTGDTNDIFKIEVMGAESGDLLKTVKSTFKLIHLNSGCALYSHNKQLPKWGWEQLEVTCNPIVRDKKNLWNFEGVQDQRLPNKSFEVFAPSFIEKLMEAHAVMVQGNSGLKPKEGEVTSQPWQWPIDYRGQWFSGGDHKVYLLGNPVIWWLNLVGLGVFCLAYTFDAVKQKRGYIDTKCWHDYKERSLKSCSWLLLGWGLHYVPFWSMGRILYFHHYFPALMYSMMITGIMLDYLIKSISTYFPNPKLSSMFINVSLSTVAAALLYSFYLFSPLVYGMSGPTADKEDSMMYGLKWMSSWDF